MRWRALRLEKINPSFPEYPNVPEVSNGPCTVLSWKKGIGEKTEQNRSRNFKMKVERRRKQSNYADSMKQRRKAWHTRKRAPIGWMRWVMTLTRKKIRKLVVGITSICHARVKKYHKCD